MNEIENALNNLESQNENIHSKLRELLESNREVRREMASLGLDNGKSERSEPKSSREHKSSRNTVITSDESQLQKMHNLSLNGANESSNNNNESQSNKTARSARSTKSKK